MSSSAEAKAAKKLARRRKRKERLARDADKSAARSGAPNHGISESTLLEMRMRVEELTRSNNQLVEELDAMKKLDVPAKALESHYMLRAVITLLVQKGVFNEPEMQDLVQVMHLADSGLFPKEGPQASVVEPGDVALLRFKIFDGGDLVDEEEAPVAYDVGSNRFGVSDEQLVGMRREETRTITGRMLPGYRVPKIVGRDVTIRVACDGVMMRRKAAAPAAQAG